MKLTEIELHNFRNYVDQTLEFSDGINVFLGENAQGKTNLLEAIYVLALTRSHRTNNEKELINWNSQTAQIKGRLQKRLGTVPIELDLGSKGKRAKVNHLEQAKLSTYIGQLNVILFAPEDLSIVKGAPQVRRRFMDMEFAQMSNRYLYNSTQYKKILKQRNRYLKDLHYKRQKDRVYLDVLSDQLSAYGAEILILDQFDAENPFIEGLPAVKQPMDTIRMVKKLTGRLIGIRLIAASPESHKKLSRGMIATPQNAVKAAAMGANVLLIAGDHSSIKDALREIRKAIVTDFGQLLLVMEQDACVEQLVSFHHFGLRADLKAELGHELQVHG